MELNLGKIYEKNLDKRVKKSLGKYYTPEFIIRYIVEKTLGNIDIINNPFVKIADISCGVGYFLLEAYDFLKLKFIEEIENLKEKYAMEIYELKKNGETVKVLGKDYWTQENIKYHILKNCLYGADKDSLAVEITRKMLIDKDNTSYADDLNIINCDSLVRWENDSNSQNETLKRFWDNKFDVVIGNPPYIGHKQLDMEYKNWLLKEYDDVFKDKSDISYCFIKRILEILKPNGIAGIITSRYFMESPTGAKLREYLMKNANILEIVDFYGAEIFKNTGIATAIYIFTKENPVKNEIEIKKLKDDNYRFSNKDNLNELLNTDLFEKFSVEKEKLSPDRWILTSSEKLRIYEKIESKANFSLKDIAISFQGVITGCDRAFVLTKKDIDEYNIEDGLLKKWIKNSNIEKFVVNDTDLFLIYSDLINDVMDYPNSIKFIERFRDRLENRRECRKGYRKWYQLQWGRDLDYFERPKIVFPYKSNENRFALDLNNSLFSADIYALIIREEFKDKISLEYLLGILNSNIYEFYFKLFSKKIGKGVYDYYPNSVLDLKIVTGDITAEITEKVRRILELIQKGNNSENIIRERTNSIRIEIDEILSSYLKLTKSEIRIINDSISR